MLVDNIFDFFQKFNYSQVIEKFRDLINYLGRLIKPVNKSDKPIYQTIESQKDKIFETTHIKNFETFQKIDKETLFIPIKQPIEAKFIKKEQLITWSTIDNELSSLLKEIRNQKKILGATNQALIINAKEPLDSSLNRQLKDLYKKVEIKKGEHLDWHRLSIEGGLTASKILNKYGNECLKLYTELNQILKLV